MCDLGAGQQQQRTLQERKLVQYL